MRGQQSARRAADHISTQGNVGSKQLNNVQFTLLIVKIYVVYRVVNRIVN